tara:strand:+ start:349 stop:1116 length:768 start_codon:yes stop_codon:yes gene_type:complete
MKHIFNLSFILIFFISCSQKKGNNDQEMLAKDNKDIISLEKIDNDWISLSDGKSFDGWHIFKKDGVDESWDIEDGAMVYVGGADGNSTGNDLISDKEFSSFLLSMDWKISKGGNSGVFYGVSEESDFNQPYFTAPEIQVIDNDNYDWSPGADGKSNTHVAGALYDLVGPSVDVVNPTGEWNNYTIEINYNTNKGSITLNGTNIVNYPLYGDDWDKMIKNSKFKDWNEFGTHRKGRIGLQDHGKKVWYKNIKIKAL